MQFIADFHIHSKYSRATSKDMNLEELDKWAKLKGIKVISCGDFTHPEWFKELKAKLEEAEPGLYKLKTNDETRFILTVEISCIYSKGGKVRKIHILIFAPSLEVAQKINTQLGWRGNLKADGRPILGLDAKELAKIVLNISPDCLVVPAHCLLPDTVVHTKDNLLKPIQNIRKGDSVITHNHRWRKVTEIFKRPYNGKVYHIQLRNFSLGLTTTSEHPFYAIRTHKNCHWSGGICKPSHQDLEECKHKYFKNYKSEWLMASQLEKGDVLIYPRFKEVFTNHRIIDLKEVINPGTATIITDKFIAPTGARNTPIKLMLPIDRNFCRLVGYYLAEGYTNSRDLVGFAFSRKEKDYVKEVIDLMEEVFEFSGKPKLRTNETGGVEIIFYSKILCETFKNLFYSSDNLFNANTKTLPTWALGLPLDLQVEIFRCWWRGDAGYTASRSLMNQMKIILLRLGIVPSIYIDKKDSYNSRHKHFINSRKINARYDMYSFNRLSFYEDKFNLLKEPEFASVARYNKGSKYGWIDNDYIYLPIYNIKTEKYRGEVYNLEVEEDNSYITEFATVHNCMTPWFAVFGSKSGFDSIEECFEDYSKYIYAAETGLSADPKMLWRMPALDKITLISNSDSHSARKIGREANVFDTGISYRAIAEAIKSKDPQKFLYTIEFFPEEGKYHYDGHRLCQVSLKPSDSKKSGNVCPNCGKPLTIGVLNRVEELADRPEGAKPANTIPFKSLVPLEEIIAEALGVLPGAKQVETEYSKLIKNFGSEFEVLLNASHLNLEQATLPEIAEGIKRVREGKVQISPGYDGVYGKVKIFPQSEALATSKQKSLF